VLSLGAPWLAARRVEDAYGALTRGDAAEAAATAESARALNPLSLEVILAGALAERERGRAREAYRLYLEAVNLEPRNPDAWFARGAFELRAGYPELALRSLRRSQQLDPYGGGLELERLLGEAERRRRP
jgi:tetratricopeptide (TPR) repeat protein